MFWCSTTNWTKPIMCQPFKMFKTEAPSLIELSRNARGTQYSDVVKWGYQTKSSSEEQLNMWSCAKVCNKASESIMKKASTSSLVWVPNVYFWRLWDSCQSAKVALEHRKRVLVNPFDLQKTACPPYGQIAILRLHEVGVVTILTCLVLLA